MYKLLKTNIEYYKNLLFLAYLKDKDKNNKPQTLYKPTPAHMVKKSFEKDVKGNISKYII